MSITQTIRPSKSTVNRFLTIDGNPLTPVNINANYAGSPTVFYVQPLPNEIFVINSLFWSVVDAGGILPTGYGSGPMLTNGVTLEAVYDGGARVEFLGNFKQNSDYQNLANEFYTFNYQSNAVGVRATFDYLRTGFKQGIVLHGYHQDKIRVTVSDDMTNFTSQVFGVSGGSV